MPEKNQRGTPPGRWMPERRSQRPWRGSRSPARVLMVRFHALGDVALVLPAASHVSRRWPGASVDLLTMSAAGELARAAEIFRSVLIFPSGRSRAGRLATAVRTGLALRRMKYDVIIDLQRNLLSRIIRRISGPSAWSEFDRFSPSPAPERVLTALSECGITDPSHEIPVPLRSDLIASARQTLAREGWDGSTRLVVFNPAGLWRTRNWPLSNYVELCRLWSQHEPVRVLVLGTERVAAQGDVIARGAGRNVINLAGKTNTAEAFAILRHASVIVTEDSGLMHMAWGAGVPIVALFGSSRSQWSAPQGSRAVCLDSSDLECGCCMEPECRFGDVRCLTRRTPGMVLRAALDLLSRLQTQPPMNVT